MSIQLLESFEEFKARHIFEESSVSPDDVTSKEELMAYGREIAQIIHGADYNEKMADDYIMKVCKKHSDDYAAAANALKDWLDTGKDIFESVNEKRVVYKRQYTENYPAQKMSTNAKVRNKIFDALKDGVITNEEINGIIDELQANPRWFKRNSGLFKEGKDGQIRLSKKGMKMYNSYKKSTSDVEDVSEGLKVLMKKSNLEELIAPTIEQLPDDIFDKLEMGGTNITPADTKKIRKAFLKDMPDMYHDDIKKAKDKDIIEIAFHAVDYI